MCFALEIHIFESCNTARSSSEFVEISEIASPNSNINVFETPADLEGGECVILLRWHPDVWQLHHPSALQLGSSLDAEGGLLKLLLGEGNLRRGGVGDKFILAEKV